MRHSIILATLVSAFAGVGCHQALSSPAAPSVMLPPAPTAFTAGIPSGTTSTAVTLDANGGAIFTDTPWSSTLVVSGARPAFVSYTCGAAGAAQYLDGFIGAHIISCSFPAPGTYTVTASAVANTGLTTNATTTVVASTRPPAPTPAPTPAAPTLRLFLACSPPKAPAAATTPMPCNVSATFGGDQVTSGLSAMHWDWGNGDTTETAGPTTTYSYKQQGTYTVVAKASYKDNTASTALTMVVPTPSS